MKEPGALWVVMKRITKGLMLWGLGVEKGEEKGSLLLSCLAASLPASCRGRMDINELFHIISIETDEFIIHITQPASQPVDEERRKKAKPH